MDRNEYIQAGTGILNVALRKESVDRNGRIMNVSNGLKRSLSARRAWIEMWIPQPAAARPCGRSPQGERG